MKKKHPPRRKKKILSQRFFQDMKNIIITQVGKKFKSLTAKKITTYKRIDMKKKKLLLLCLFLRGILSKEGNKKI